MGDERHSPEVRNSYMYIVDIKRTPIGKFLGSLSELSAPELAKPLFSYFLKTYPYLKSKTDEVVIGNVLSAGIGMNPARIAAMLGGIDESVPSYTVNHVCASGMNAIIQGFRLIRTGDAHLVLAGGMESMSQAPYLLMGARKGLKFGSQMVIDSLQHDGLYCSLFHGAMGVTAENVAKKYAISRASQDRYALSSHQKAMLAKKHNAFANEIIEMVELKVDEGPRKDTSLEKLASLKPVFKDGGTVTAGNTSTINDGAALALLASEKAVHMHGLKPMARIKDSIFVGLEPALMGMGPKFAIEKLLKKNSLSLNSIDLFEINEAFASQVLAVIQELKIDGSKVNMYGGAIALGHPLGMSGARIIGTLITGLKQTKGKLGIATLCVGGGQGAAILLENI